jgi:GT2 family glycosyltransferase
MTTASSIDPDQHDASVTVICVNFNGGVLLAECVRSVLTSSAPVQVLVADNGSSDGSVSALRAALAADARVTIVEYGRNLGFAKANNAVLPLATGEFLLFLNPDCRIGPETVAWMLAVMESNPGAGMAGCLIRDPDGSEQRGCRRRVPRPWPAFGRAFALDRLFRGFAGYASLDMTGEPLPAQPVEVEAISGAFMFVRLSALQKVGLLDEGYFLHCEDLDWCWRFRQAGYPVLFVPSVAITHLKGASSGARPIRVEWHKHRGMLRFYRKFFLKSYPWPLALLVAVGVWLRFIAVAARLTLRRSARS